MKLSNVFWVLILQVAVFCGGSLCKGHLTEGTVRIPKQLQSFAERYPEVETFVQNYPYEYNKSHYISLSVKQGEIPLFLQWDERWGYTLYGDGWIGDSGCGPTALSMVVCGLTGTTNWNPKEVASFAMENGWYIDGVGTSWSLMTDGAEQLGVHGMNIEITEDVILDQLTQGHPCICSMRPGDFTKGGHFIVLTGIDENGQVIINDPNSPYNSEIHWDMDRILPQIKQSWSFTHSDF